VLVWLRSEEDHGAAADLPGREDGGGALGGGWTVAVVPLVVHVDAATVNLGGAPGGPCWLSPVYPVGAAVVSHPAEGEGEDAGLAGGRATCHRTRRAAGHCSGARGARGGCGARSGGRGCRSGGGGHHSRG